VTSLVKTALTAIALVGLVVASDARAADASSDRYFKQTRSSSVAPAPKAQAPEAASSAAATAPAERLACACPAKG
jgi:hypothetical protein